MQSVFRGELVTVHLLLTDLQSQLNVPPNSESAQPSSVVAQTPNLPAVPGYPWSLNGPLGFLTLLLDGSITGVHGIMLSCGDSVEVNTFEMPCTAGILDLKTGPAPAGSGDFAANNREYHFLSARDIGSPRPFRYGYSCSTVCLACTGFQTLRIDEQPSFAPGGGYPA